MVLILRAAGKRKRKPSVRNHVCPRMMLHILEVPLKTGLKLSVRATMKREIVDATRKKKPQRINLFHELSLPVGYHSRSLNVCFPGIPGSGRPVTVEC